MTADSTLQKRERQSMVDFNNFNRNAENKNKSQPQMDRIRAEQPPQRPPKASALSLLGLSNQSSNEANALELNESDVVWSFTNENNGNNVEIESTSPSSVSVSSKESESPTTFSYPDRKFGQQKYGLSAVLAEEHRPLVRRKASPSIGMTTTAVRTIPRSRKGSPNSDGSVGSACGGRFNMSAPVNIPVWCKMRNRSMGRFEEEEEEEDGGEAVDGEMLPPHEVVAARSQTMTFSVFEGVGRTLKGRDLRRVRNAVFQQTGFID